MGSLPHRVTNCSGSPVWKTKLPSPSEAVSCEIWNAERTPDRAVSARSPGEGSASFWMPATSCSVGDKRTPPAGLSVPRASRRPAASSAATLATGSTTRPFARSIGQRR